MLNHIALQGRLTNDVELRYTQAGKPVASFAIAVDRDFRGRDGNKETDFINIVSWGRTGELCGEWLHKGDMATISGRLQMRDWTDRDGNKRKSAEVVANSVYFPPKRREDERHEDGGVYPPDDQFEELYDSDSNLPF